MLPKTNLEDLGEWGVSAGKGRFGKAIGDRSFHKVQGEVENRTKRINCNGNFQLLKFCQARTIGSIEYLSPIKGEVLKFLNSMVAGDHYT